MKNVITFLMCTLFVISAMAQSDLSGDQMVFPERTPELNALYQQAKNLEENGTAAEINANRHAIKNAWQAIDPNVAALYKPIATQQTTYIGGNERHIPITIQQRPDSPEDWGTDKLIKDSWIDGVDMDVTKSGDIYIAAYENYINFGGEADSIYVYRSTNNGDTFTKWKSVASISPITKMQIISIDGTGDNYLLAYLNFENNLFQLVSWNMATGDLDFGNNVNDVIDFSVDRNYPTNTNAQRVFVTYQKSNFGIFSARSTAGSYGFDWVDEYGLNLLGEQIDFSYGRDGGCYTTFIGLNSRSVRAIANSNSNDPASWGTRETLTDGSTVEVINPTISAAKLASANDKVLIWASQRAAGSTNNYNGIAFKRENGGAYSKFSDFSSGGSNWDVAHTDSWIRRTNDTQIIRTSYVKANISGAENSTNRSLTFNGNDFDAFEPVADPSVNVFNGFASAIAETNDKLPCVAFAGTGNGGYGYGLYFDKKSTLGVDENTFENFKIYPNPTQDILNLSANNTIENVSVFSLLGQKVMETSIDQNKASINTAHLSPGVYLMNVIIEGKSATYKFIKQ